MTHSDKKNFNDSLPDNDEIDLRELFYIVWKGKIQIILITFVIAICSIFYSLSLTNYYSSESILTVRDSSNSSALSQYSGIASLAGVNLPTLSDSNSVINVIEGIKSRDFVKHLMTFENVLPSLMAAKSYDSETQELYFDSEIYDAKTKTWTREAIKNKGPQPSYLETHKKYLNEILSISQDLKTGLVYIRIEHISPIFAKDFLTLIIKEANTMNRKKDIDTSSKALSYLKIELSQTPKVEIKKTINNLIETQLQKQMMANIHDEYSLISLEPPFIPEERSKPSRSLIVILSTLIGGVLSVVFVLFRHFALDNGT